MKTYTVLFALAFLASYVGTPILRAFVSRWGLLDSTIAPGRHEGHSVPRLGGVIVYFALLGTLLALFFPTNVITQEFRSELPTLWLLWGPATLILLVGVADDVWGMSAWVKLAGQLLAALWLVGAGVRISHLSLPWGETAELGWLSTGITLLWLVGLTNAFNLIDGLDGLAAGVAFLSASAIAATAMMIDDKIVVILTVTLAGALLGFLRHNFAPATIILGDSGSMFIGFLLAAAAVVWHQKATTAIAVAAPLLAFALPVTDTAVSMLRRYLRGQSMFASDRQHIHHRLLARGFTARQAVLLLYGVSALAAFGCILIARGHNIVTGMVLFLFMAASWFGVRRLAYPEFTEVSRAFSRQRLGARSRLDERIELIRQAGSGPELWKRLADSGAALELDYLGLELTLDQRARLQLPELMETSRPGSGDQRYILRLLSIPLPSGGFVVLGRNPRHPFSYLPLEEVGKELSVAVDETLSRLAKLSTAPVAAESSEGQRQWASSAKS